MQQLPSNLHHRPIGDRIDWLFERVRQHAADFCSPDAVLARQRYLAEHPTAIAVMKCMDGRINIPVATQTPPGIIQPFRNLGGMFDLGWPHLGEILAHYVQRRIQEGRRVLLLVTYHFSRGDAKRGCAGFRYDTDAAIAHTQAIRQQVSAVFGQEHATVYPLICGFETDEEALLIHGPDGSKLDLADWSVDRAGELPGQLRTLLPDLPERMLNDLLPLLEGNLRHLAHVRTQNRTLDIEHREWMICLWRGFDFLHMPNLALIVGPYSPMLAEPISVAAKIINSNMREGRIPADGFLLLASVPYDDIGSDRARAELKARFLASFAERVIGESHPELAGRMHTQIAVLEARSRRLERLEKAN